MQLMKQERDFEKNNIYHFLIEAQNLTIIYFVHIG